MKYLTKIRRVTPKAPPPHPVWTSAFAMAGADAHCAYCRGVGLLDEGRPCGCVLRGIFRACLRQFHGCCEFPYWGDAPDYGDVNLECNPWITPEAIAEAHYAADFLALAKRHLHGQQLKLFGLHHVHGMQWKECSAKLGLDRGEFFHEAYRVAERLGRACAELQPYALYPVYEYFAPTPIKFAPIGDRRRVTAAETPKLLAKAA